MRVDLAKKNTVWYIKEAEGAEMQSVEIKTVRALSTGGGLQVKSRRLRREKQASSRGAKEGAERGVVGVRHA